jgi:hypothetical protein
MSRQEVTMRFGSRACRAIALALSALNVGGLGYAVGVAEPWHAGLHAALALGFGFAAARMRRRGAAADAETDAANAIASGERAMEPAALDGEMEEMRRELYEVQERLDFAERMLSRELESRRVDVER